MPSVLSTAAAAAGLACAAAEQLKRTPPMGWNSWNHFNCGVDDAVLRGAADAMAASLASAGYEYVNTDDCWDTVARDPTTGAQVPDPAKFPAGFQATIDYVHSKNLKFGLYTARGHNTCAGRAASCGNEALDAKTYASWNVDYIKDDDCGDCTEYLLDYGHMQQGIWATGRAMYLSVEGDPDPAVATHGGYGQQKRVGHDITSTYRSMVSLVDIGSGLWPFAHNGSRFTNASNADPLPFFNDLDMVEIANGEFDTSTPLGVTISQTHMTMWSIMKSPLLLGNDLTTMAQSAIQIVTNAEAIAVNQDPLVAQARRVAVYMPANNTLGATAWDGSTVVAKCDASRPTQSWHWKNVTQSGQPHNLLYLATCNAADPFQQWTFAGAGGATPGALLNKGAGLCVDANAQVDPAKLVACSATAPGQSWILQPGSAHLVVSGTPSQCLDVFNYEGPDVEVGSSKPPGQSDSNQQWIWNAATGQIMSNSTGVSRSASCLSASVGPTGGLLYTTDTTGKQWCLDSSGGEGEWGPSACDPTSKTLLWTPALVGGGSGPWPPAGPQNYTLTQGAGGVYYNNQQYASGPWPHTRYAGGYSWVGSAAWTMDLAAAISGPGTRIQAADTQSIIDDDLVGGVTVGGAFCLDFVTFGMLEAWVSELTGGRFAVALFNRSPAADTIAVTWANLGVAASARFTVRDIWAAADRGAFTGSYSATVAAHATAFLVLTPA